MPAQLKSKARIEGTPSSRRAGVAKHANSHDSAVKRSKSTRGALTKALESSINTSASSKTVVHKSYCAANDTAVVELARQQSVKRKRSEDDPTTPRNKRFKDALPPTPAQTPTKKTSLDNEASSPGSKHLDAAAYSTPPMTPRTSSSIDLPQELQDLLSMNSAFLSAISLSLAHNGASSTLFLPDILRQAARSWKKRRVTLQDVQRLLGLLNTPDPILTLIDSGSDKIHLEPTRSVSTIVANQSTLIAQFTSRLQRRWAHWSTQHDIQGFLSSLPVSPINEDSTTADAARISKGLSRLNLLRQDSKLARQEAQSTQSAGSVSSSLKTPSAVSNRGTSLLDRVLAKQRHLESLPQAPTKPQLARAAALDRIEEAALTLGLLIPGSKPRVGLSLPGAVKHLQDSMRNPIAREEAELCLRIMAEEVVPGFVELVGIGNEFGVVVKRAGRMGNVALKEAIRAARERV